LEDAERIALLAVPVASSAVWATSAAEGHHRHNVPDGSTAALFEWLFFAAGSGEPR
jgi:hypothetical protein